MENNKGNNKFLFVDRDSFENKNKDVNNNTNEVKKYEINRFYFGFKQRVSLIILLIFIIFGLGSYLVFNSYKLKKGDVVSYSEKSELNYKVCLLDNSVYNESCLRSGMVYNSSLVNTIPVVFNYNVSFSEIMDYQSYYHVILYTKIFDKDNKDKVLYENKDILIEKTYLSKNDKNISISNDFIINYKKYNDFINKYKVNYSSNIDARLEAVLYVDEYDDERNVGSISIPLGKNTFEVNGVSLNNVNKTVEIPNMVMDTESDLSMFLGCFLIIISLILDFVLINLVKTTLSKKNKYTIVLEKILKEYDDKIVNISSDYITDKDIIKVESIKELVDASDVINKPILYSKINNIKCEFILEDDDKVYKYVLKEVDIEK